jgi:hypothetical protein
VATITTSQTFDSAARTAGEAFTINSGAIFTIDSDTCVIWRGSRIMGKVIMWFISLASALAAGWVAAKKLILF